MQTHSLTKVFFGALFAVLALAPAATAEVLNNNEVEFTGTVSFVVENGEGVGTLFVTVSETTLRVLINARTEIEDADEIEIEMEDIAIGARATIKGKFSASGILASHVQIKASDNQDNSFDIRGHITEVGISGELFRVSLLGIAIEVPSNLKADWDGAEVPVSVLKTGMLVKIGGTIAGDTWAAEDIRILSKEKKRDPVRFVGTIIEIGDGKLLVAVGEADQGVLIDDNTRVYGELVLGALVEVRGFLNAVELSITAKVIEVLQALEIKPDSLKLKVGDVRQMTVQLREAATSDTLIKLSIAPTTKASLLSSKDLLPIVEVTIPKDSRSAPFAVKGLEAGTATITAELLEQKAAAEVTVGTQSDDDTGTSEQAIRMAFAPDRIKMGPNETRDVVLLVKPPQREFVEVKLESKGGLVISMIHRELSDGVALYKVTITSDNRTGTDSVVATLPKIADSGEAELVVEVIASPGGKAEEFLEIDFRPDSVKLDVGDTRTVNLMISRVQPAEVELPLMLSPPSSAAVAIPATAKIPAGQKYAQVTVKGVEPASVKLVASLPSGLGTDKATLDIEVRSKK